MGFFFRPQGVGRVRRLGSQGMIHREYVGNLGECMFVIS